jgi:dTDP-4-amino-4,6-dideoxy-D-glucose acyltransferase
MVSQPMVRENICGRELGSVYSADELRDLFGSVGENVSVNRSVVVYSGKDIHIGSHVRIDCFCILSASSLGIFIGDYVHIAAYSALSGSGGEIRMESFSGLSSRVTLLTATDDYVDGFMSNPTVPEEYKKVTSGDVVLKKHVLIGSGSVIMPGVTLETGACVGALSFINKNVPEFAIAAGIPSRIIGQRNRRLLELEAAFLAAKNRE